MFGPSVIFSVFGVSMIGARVMIGPLSCGAVSADVSRGGSATGVAACSFGGSRTIVGPMGAMAELES